MPRSHAQGAGQRAVARGDDERRRATYIPSVTEISTPCIRICILDPDTGCCEGCGRTLEEVAGWLRMSEAERRRIMAELDGRARRPSPPRDERA
jgi:predicted Fe-S protein YdhL (DUF1289 family)